MRRMQKLLLVSLILIMGCSREAPEQSLTDPGFGVTTLEIKAGAGPTNLPVYLKSAEPVKGIQFTLKWDPTIGQVSQPVLAPGNPGFTVSSNQGRPGSMKVLVFSLQGDILDPNQQEILNIPIEISSSAAERFTLRFDEAVFAGPSAKSYAIPVSHADLRIMR